MGVVSRMSMVANEFSRTSLRLKASAKNLAYQLKADHPKGRSIGERLFISLTMLAKVPKSLPLTQLKQNEEAGLILTLKVY